MAKTATGKRTKIKLTESIASARGCHRAGTVLEFDAKTAERLVCNFQAEFDGDPVRTAKCRKNANAKTLFEKIRKDTEPKKPAKQTDALSALNLTPQGIKVLKAKDPKSDVPAFTGIKQLSDWINSGGDLTKKAKIGPKSADEIKSALAEYLAKQGPIPEPEVEDEEDVEVDDDFDESLLDDELDVDLD